MTLRIAQIVETSEPQAGSVTSCLTGQDVALRAHDIEVLSCPPVDQPGNGNGRDDFRQRIQQSDAVHVFGWGYPHARMAVGLARKYKKPYVLSPVGALCENPHQRPSLRQRLRCLVGERGFVRGARMVTAFNDRESQELRTLGVSSTIVDLPCGFSFDQFDQQTTGSVEISKLPDGRIILLLAPIHPEEGFVPLVKAFAELGPVTDGWSMVVAGAALENWKEMLQAAVKRKGGEDRIIFLDAPNPATQRALLERASCLVAPSLQVRCPTSIYQALAVGVPVLATHLTAPAGMKDVIRVCAPTKSEFKQGLTSILSLSDDQRAELAKRGQKICREKFDWSVLADNYSKLYRRVTDRNQA